LIGGEGERKSSKDLVIQGKGAMETCAATGNNTNLPMACMPAMTYRATRNDFAYVDPADPGCSSP
jgi:hypothetical protein